MQNNQSFSFSKNTATVTEHIIKFVTLMHQNVDGIVLLWPVKGELVLTTLHMMTSNRSEDKSDGSHDD